MLSLQEMKRQRSLSILAPSLLSADFSKLNQEIQEIEQAGVDWIHLDIMDGHFVPNLTIGSDVISSIRKCTNLFFDCHLMVTNPENWIEPFVKAGVNSITVHIETNKNFSELFKKIKSFNCGVGISIKPNTPVSSIASLINEVDLVLVMSVEPGFGGQKFMDIAYSKIEELKQLREKTNNHFLIEVDGGVGLSNIAQLKKSGADIFVAGSAVFGSKDRKKAIQDLKKYLK